MHFKLKAPGGPGHLPHAVVIDDIEDAGPDFPNAHVLRRRSPGAVLHNVAPAVAAVAAESEVVAVARGVPILLVALFRRPQAEAAVRKAKAGGGGMMEFEPLFRRALELVR